jgi:hypothetical protein
MNAHTSHNTNDAKPVRKLAVDRIVSEELFPEPLMDAEEIVHNAFIQLTTDTARPVLTSKVTEAAGYKNEDFVRGKLWELARNGYIAAYRKKGRWMWCRKECVAGMLKVEPQLKMSFDQLPKREDGQPI